MESEKNVRRAIVDSLKREFLKAKWWNEVQGDVKNRLNWMVEHIQEAGPRFTHSFMSLFRWEFERRKLEGEDVVNPLASYFSTLMGMRISEEAYQCGFLPTRACLNLYDFLEPNDADVAACLMFCHKVEILEKTGMLSMDKIEQKIHSSDISKLLRNRKKQDKPVQEETIVWESEEDQN